jgi:hypothetical protein
VHGCGGSEVYSRHCLGASLFSPLRGNVLVAFRWGSLGHDLVVTPLFADIEGLLFGEPKPNIVLRVPERGRADRARNNSYWQWKIGIPLIKYKFTCGPPPAGH